MIKNEFFYSFADINKKSDPKRKTSGNLREKNP